MVFARLRALGEGLSLQHGAKVRVDLIEGYPATVNHEAQAELAGRAAIDVAGADKVDIATPPIMAAEDFSFMLNTRPGAFVFIGNGPTAGLHNPAYDFNDDAIPAGVSFFARVVETAMPA